MFKKYYSSLPITNKFFVGMILLIIIPFLILLFVIPYRFYKEEIAERRNDMQRMVNVLDRRVHGSFTEMLNRREMLDRPLEEQVLILNSMLQPIVNDTASADPSLTLGYYSIEQDSVVAVWPFENSMLMSFPRTSPYFKLYETGEPVFFEINSIALKGEPVLGWAKPIVKDGKIVGHAWASVKVGHIQKQAFKQAGFIILFGLLMLAGAILISRRVYGWFKKELECFAKSFIENNLTPNLIPEINPLLQQVKEYVAKIETKNEELKKSHEQTNDILDCFSGDFVAVDNEWKIIYLNDKAMRRFFPKTRGETLNEKIWNAFPELLDQNIYQRLNQAMSVQKASAIRTLVDRQNKWFFVHAYPFHGGLCLYFRDISEQKRIEDEMARLDRLDLVGQMASAIGHEIRNPLTTVRGFLQLLGRKEELMQHKEYFDLMIEELDRSNAIITEFLSVAKDKAVDLKKQDLNSIINSLYPLMLADALNSGKQLKLMLETIPNLLLDEKEIRQLILNLVRNGFEAMLTGGTLTIKTFADNGGVNLSVHDQGMGIEPGVIDKIGIPFFSTKENGTGLGLAVCYSVAKRHNALINIDTGPEGTTFSVKIPIGLSNPA